MVFPRYRSLIHALHLGVVLLVGTTALSGQRSAEVVYRDATGHLRYLADEENNYVPDFSHAGYHNGERPLPRLPVVKRIGPIEGDATAHIQQALEEVGTLPIDENGWRGTLLLAPGRYEVAGQLFLRHDGVVLRGSGRSADPAESTIIVGTGNRVRKRSLVVVGGLEDVSWTVAIPGTTAEVVSEFVPTGSRSLEIFPRDAFEVGDRVMVEQTSTHEWLASIDFGATGEDEPWTPGQRDIYYSRRVVAVDRAEGKIVLNAPIYDHVEPALAPTKVYKWNDAGTFREVGIEDLRIEIATEGPEDEKHAWTCIELKGVEDGWVRNVTGLHFGFALVTTGWSNRVTVTHCEALEPHSRIIGSRRYNFNASVYSNNILFTHNRADRGRHTYVANGGSRTTGIVFTHSESRYDYGPSEGHQRWSMGLLYDNIRFLNPRYHTIMGLYNRGDFGSGHGWSSINSVAWNVDGAGKLIVIQRPPGRQNYAFGCQGPVVGRGPFKHPTGHIELSNKELAITSLYDAQLKQRLDRGSPPDAPARLVGTCSEAGIVLEWTDIAGDETGYQVVRRRGQGLEDEVLLELPAGATEALLPNEFRAETELRVVAVNGAGPSAYSNAFRIYDDRFVREARPEELSVSPNPSNGRFTVHSEETLTAVTVYDARGAVRYAGSGAGEIDATAWPAGFYYLRGRSDCGEVLSVRIVIH